MIIRYLSPLALAGATLGVAGCGLQPQSGTNPTAPISGAAVKLTGVVHGGQQPVVNATIQLYAVGNTGYGSSATPLLTNTVTTNSGGFFSITGDYTCPPNAEVYLTATGGNPIVGSAANANLALMAALGPCSGLTSSSQINVNELTTVGSVWPLARFMAGYANVGASATNSAGIAQAFSAVKELTDVSQGAIPGPSLPSNATLSVNELNTLANILAACINSTGGVAGDGSACGNLFAAATPAGGSAPTDTIGAAINIARHPGTNVGTLFTVGSTSPPFQPALTQAPNNYLIGVTYTGGGVNAPSSVAIDALGNVWLANAGNASVTQLSSTGSMLSPSTGWTGGGLNAPSSLAVGLDGTIWVANKSGNSASQFNSVGVAMAGSPHTGGGIDAPDFITIDGFGNIWLANSGVNSISELNSSGGPLSTSTGYTGGGLNQPSGIAVNPF